MKVDLEKVNELQTTINSQEITNKQDTSGIAEVLAESAELITVIPDMLDLGASAAESAGEGLSIVGELLAGIGSLFS